jgi:hypothetical protein
MPIEGAFMAFSFTSILQALRCADIPIDESAHTKPKATTPSSKLKQEPPLDPNIIGLLVSSPFFQQYSDAQDTSITSCQEAQNFVETLLPQATSA